MKLNPKQQRFVDEYLIDLNATQAAIRAGYSWQDTTAARFYVYLLIDPRDGRVFYVGKGTKNRMRDHAKAAKRGVADNAGKFAAITSVLNSGCEVVENVFFTTSDEADAFRVERAMISALRDFGLTNITAGASSNAGLHRVTASALLSRMKSFTDWASSLNAESLAQIERIFGTPERAYNEVCAGLRGVAAV